MAQTVVGLFENTGDAQNAAQALMSNGFSRDQIDLAAHNASNDTGDSISNFFNSLFGDGDEARSYTEAARSGSTILTIHARTTQEAQTASSILDQNNAIDMDARMRGTRNTTSETANTGTAIPVIEEHLEIGKRTVETGGARIRSRVIEKPVEESIRLRQEHLVVERHPVNRAATDADFANVREGEITLTEHGEVPTVGKEARVVEEVVVGKQVGEETQTVRDTVRRTDVEVEEVNRDTTDNRQTRSAKS